MPYTFARLLYILIECVFKVELVLVVVLNKIFYLKLY